MYYIGIWKLYVSNLLHTLPTSSRNKSECEIKLQLEYHEILTKKITKISFSLSNTSRMILSYFNLSM